MVNSLSRCGKPSRGLLQAFAIGVLSAFVVNASGCDDAPTAPSDFAPFSRTDLRVGTGAEAVQGSQVSVFYTGWFFNAAEPEQKGAVFDSSGPTPFTFTVGADQVIDGWDQGVVGMKVGGLRRLVIPPSLAYGNRRNGTIPPNATLVFEIELLEIL